MVARLDRLAGRAQLLPVGQLADDRGALGPDGRGGLAAGCARSWLSASARRAAAGNGSVPRRWPTPGGAVRHAQERHRRASVRGSRPGSGPGARCGCPVRSRDRPPPMCIRQDAVAGGADLGPGAEHVAHLVGQHRRGGVGVLDRERAAEAAAHVGVGQLDQLQPGHVAQQPQRPVADPQHPQRVAGRVVGDPVRVVGADVLDAEHVDRAARTARSVRPATASARRASSSSPDRRATIACWCRTEPAHDPDGMTIAS